MKRTLILLLLFFIMPLPVLAQTSDTLTEQRTETPDGYRIDYLDADGVLTMATNRGYASVVRKVEAGHTVEEYFYDADGNPVNLSGACGRAYFYQEDACIRVTYLDAHHQPTKNSSGYATLHRTYDENGRIKTEMYFDTLGAPTALQLGQYGIRYLRSESGKHIGTTYLDVSGEPMVNKQGYTTVGYEYDALGHIICQRYYDKNGAPVAMSRGQYGQVSVYQEKTFVRSYYIDKNDRELFLLDQFLSRNPAFNLMVAVVLTIAAVVLPRQLRFGLLLSYVVFILYMTLFVREQGDPSHNFQLFWSYRLALSQEFYRTEIYHNILLFVPLGALLYCQNRHPLSLLLALLFSVFIEATQLIFGLGLCELDDIVSNGLGGCIGWGLALVLSRVQK